MGGEMQQGAAALRRVRPIGLVAAASGVLGLLSMVWAFALPHDDALPKRADVAFVLGPPKPQRVAEAMALLEEGRVGHVLFVLSRDAGQPGSWSNLPLRICRSDPRTSCGYPRPTTTRGEARMLESVAREHGWSTAVLITQRAHLLRARAAVSRCLPGTLLLHESGERPTNGLLYQFAYQTAASVKLWRDRGC